MPHRLYVSVPLALYRRYERALPPLPVGLELVLDHEALAPAFAQEARAIGAELRAAGRPCRFHAPFRDLSPGGFDPAVLAVAGERQSAALALAPAFGADELVAHPGWDPRTYGEDVEGWLDRAAAFWGALAEPAAAAGTRYVLENIFDTGPEVLSALLARLPAERFGALFDVGHWHAYAQTALEPWLAALGDRLLSLHLHDNRGLMDEHLALGEGSVPWREFYGAVRSLERPLNWVLENRSVADVEVGMRHLGNHSGIAEFEGLAGAGDSPAGAAGAP